MSARTKLEEAVVKARHVLYCTAREYIEREMQSESDENFLADAVEALQALDALYALGERLHIGPVDGEPDP